MQYNHSNSYEITVINAEISSNIIIFTQIKQYIHNHGLLAGAFEKCTFCINNSKEDISA